MTLATPDSGAAWEEFLKERSITRNAQGDRSVALFLITPIGASAPYFTRPDIWSAYRPSESSTGTGPASFTPIDIVKSVFCTVDAFNSQLHEGLTSDGDARARLRLAFKHSPERLGSLTFYHGLLQSLVLDRCTWALTTIGSSDDRAVNPLPVHTAIPKQFERVHTLYRDWPSTISDFVDHWRTVSHKVVESGVDTSAIEISTTVTPSQPGPSAGGLASLLEDAASSYGVSAGNSASVAPFQSDPNCGGLASCAGAAGLAGSYADIRLAKMKYNFCLAAVGLIGLVLRQRAQEARKGDSNDGKAKPIGELLKDFFPEISGRLSKRDDYLLLRPLYTIVAVSPICMMSSLELDSETPGRRVPLYLMVDLVRHPLLEPDIRRCRIEHSLLNVVLDMAANGAGVYEAHMGRLFELWRDEYAVSPVNTAQLTASITEANADLDLASNPVKAKTEASLAVVVAKSLARSVAAGSKRARVLPVIDLTGDGEGPEWLADAVSKAGGPVPQELATTKSGNSTVDSAHTPSERNIDGQGRGKRIKKPVKRALPSETNKPLSKKRKSRKPRKKPELAEGTGSSSHADTSDDEASVHKMTHRRGKRKSVSPTPSSSGNERKKRKAADADTDEEHGTEDGSSGEDAGPVDSNKPGYRKRRSASTEPSSDASDGRAKKKRTAAEVDEDSALEDATLAEPSKNRATTETDDAFRSENAKQKRATVETDHENTEEERAPNRVSAESPKEVGSNSNYLSPPPPNQPLRPSSSDLTGEDNRPEPAKNTGYSDNSASGNVLNDADITAVNSSATRRPKARPAYGRGDLDECGAAPSAKNTPHSQPAFMSQPTTALSKLKHAFDSRPPAPKKTKQLTVMELDRSCADQKWKQRVLEIPVWPAMKADFQNIEDLVHSTDTSKEANRVLSRLAKKAERTELGPDFFKRSLITVHRAKWEAMSRQKQRRMFLKHNIHVVGMRDKGVLGIEGHSGENPLVLERLDEVVDLFQERQCHDLTVHISNGESADRLRRATLMQFIRYVQRQRDYEARSSAESISSRKPPLKRNLNFLDIPLLGTGDTMATAFDDVSKFAFGTAGAKDWNTRLDQGSLAMRWMIAGTKSAISVPHIDAAGYATWIHILSGEKVWWMARELRPPTSDAWGLPQGDAAYLKPGDDLYMRPGTIHAVLTVQDCVAIGGHFYSSGFYTDTLIACIFEHFWGSLITNTEHTKSHLMLFKAVVGISKRLVGECVSSGYLEQESISSLLLFVMYSPQLWPDLPDDSTEENWHETEEYRGDQAFAEKAAVRLARKLSKECDGFRQTLKATEHFVWSVLSLLNDKVEKHHDKYRVSRVCICGSRCGDDVAEAPSAEDGVHTEGEAEDEDAEGEAEGE